MRAIKAITRITARTQSPAMTQTLEISDIKPPFHPSGTD
jgi:hypothetical protein